MSGSLDLTMKGTRSGVRGRKKNEPSDKNEDPESIFDKSPVSGGTRISICYFDNIRFFFQHGPRGESTCSAYRLPVD